MNLPSFIEIQTLLQGALGLIASPTSTMNAVDIDLQLGIKAFGIRSLALQSLLCYEDL